SDWQKIADLAKENDLEYSFQARMSDDIRNKAVQFFSENLESHLLPTPSFNFSPQVRALISKEQKESLNLYKQTLSPYGFNVSVHENSLSLEPIIGVKILVTEMRKKHFQRLGIKWPSSYQAQVIPSLLTSTASLSLEALEENGVAK